MKIFNAIARFEKKSVRDVSQEDGIIYSYIAGQKGVKERKWYLKDGQIDHCEFSDQYDQEKNEMKINKFIGNFNLRKSTEETS